MMLQDWCALENWEIREGWGYSGVTGPWGAFWEIREQKVMGMWGCYMYMSELSDPAGRPRLHSCCGRLWAG